MARIVNEAAANGSLLSRAVERAKAGDRDALAFLYARYADDVCGYLQGIVTDVEEASEIAQCVFAHLARALAGHRERDVPFSVWLLRFAREMAADHLRERGLPDDCDRLARPSNVRAIRPLSRSAR